MTLNVAQYLAPLGSQKVLAGYPQGVIDGGGITISPDGTISLDAVEASALGFVTSKTPVPQLTWTAETPAPSSILTNNGNNGVSWTTSYVRTFPLDEPFPQTGAALLPRGTTAQRPVEVEQGFIRYNTNLKTFEWYSGTGWLTLAPNTGGVYSYVSSSQPTANAPGDFWFDSISGIERVWTGTQWAPVSAPLQPVYKTFDDISGQFDGITASFQLKIDGNNIGPQPSSNIMVFLDGSAQIPGVGKSYTVTGSIITFTNAPAPGVEFYATTVSAQ